MLRLFWWVIGIIIFLVFLGFALLNAQPVVLHYYFGQSKLPLVLILIGFLVVGGIFGLVFGYVKGRWCGRVAHKE